MSTYRERREARADRLDEWAEKREAKATAGHAEARQMADGIPFGQPILVGHYSERRDRNYRDRIHGKFERSFADAAKADEMSSKAANIRAAADGAIYSDDPDAIERLTEKLAGLEAERDRIKAYNASCRKRKAAGDTSLLDAAQRESLASTARVMACALGSYGQFPSYHLSNLGGVISTTRKRLEGLKNPAPVRAREMAARFDGDCTACSVKIRRGESILYTRGEGARHVECPGESC